MLLLNGVGGTAIASGGPLALHSRRLGHTPSSRNDAFNAQPMGERN